MESIALPLGKIKSKTVKTTKKVAKNIWTQNLSQIQLIKIVSVVLVLSLIGVGAWRIAKFYTGKIFPNVKVAGVKVGGKTPEQAKTLVQSYIDKANSQGVPLTYQDKNITPHLDELGANFNVEQTVNDAYRFGRSGNWKTRLGDNANLAIGRGRININPTYDNQKFNDKLGQIVQVVNVAPVNAGINIADGKISVTPPQNGSGVDINKVQNEITNLINKNNLNSAVAITSGVLEPAVKESGTMNAQKDAEKFMASAPINLSYEGKAYTASKTDIGAWIEFPVSGDQLVAHISGDKINSYLDTIAKQIEIKKVDKVTMAETGQVIEEGQDGLAIDRSDLVVKLAARANSGKTGENIAIKTSVIAKGEKVKNPHAEPCRFEGRYIDINLSEQTLYAFEGCTLVNQFLISSGKTGPTPTGTFHVYSKSRVTRMSGPGYDLPGVEWVSWFSGDYSIHGTYWHHNFGHPMSHGCVNASNGDAQWVYEWDDVGTPVFIHAN